MKTRRVTIACTCTLALVLLVASIARGQAEKCTNAMIKDANKVASKQGKEVRSCIKRVGKGQAVADESCLIADPKGKVLAASGKTQNDYNAKCLSQLPAFGPGSGSYDPNILNNAAIAKELAIKELVFGSDIGLPGVVVPCSTSGDDCQCQQAIAKTCSRFKRRS